MSIYDEIERFRRLIDLEAPGSMSLLSREWLAVEQRMGAIYQQMFQVASQQLSQGRSLSLNQLYRLNRYRNMLEDVHQQVSRYNRGAASYIERMQAHNVQLGVDYAQNAIIQTYISAGLNVSSFNKINPTAVQVVLGTTEAGTVLFDHLESRWGIQNVAGITKALIDGVAQGWNPRKTVSAMMAESRLPLQNALMTSRTETMRALRESSRQQFEASGVVNGYRRRAAKSGRTCIACLAADGKYYALDEPLDEHVNGRCFLQPIIIGLEEFTPEGELSTEQWFKGLPWDQQIQIMGQGRWDLWNKGELKWNELYSVHEDPKWGKQIQPAILGRSRPLIQAAGVRSILELFETAPYQVTGDELQRSAFSPVKVAIQGDGSAIMKGAEAGGFSVPDKSAPYAEAAAYKLDKMLGIGLVPETTVRMQDGEPYSMQAFIDKGIAPNEVMNNYYNGSKSEFTYHYGRYDSQQFGKMAYLDMITGQMDRHDGNLLLVGSKSQVVAIDNGLGFTTITTDDYGWSQSFTNARKHAKNWGTLGYQNELPLDSAYKDKLQKAREDGTIESMMLTTIGPGTSQALMTAKLQAANSRIDYLLGNWDEFFYDPREKRDD